MDGIASITANGVMKMHGGGHMQQTESKGKVAGPNGAAARLGIPRSTLDSKIKLLNIKKHKFSDEQ